MDPNLSIGFSVNWTILTVGRKSSVCSASALFLSTHERCWQQGPTGRGFQLRDGSGSGIREKNSGRIGYGLGTGICTVYVINRVFSGTENLDRVLFGYIHTAFTLWSIWLKKLF